MSLPGRKKKLLLFSSSSVASCATHVGTPCVGTCTRHNWLAQINLSVKKKSCLANLSLSTALRVYSLGCFNHEVIHVRWFALCVVVIHSGRSGCLVSLVRRTHRPPRDSVKIQRLHQWYFEQRERKKRGTRPESGGPNSIRLAAQSHIMPLKIRCNSQNSFKFTMYLAHRRLCFAKSHTVFECFWRFFANSQRKANAWFCVYNLTQSCEFAT